MKYLNVIPSPIRDAKTKRCLACGTTDLKGRRRYCSDECRRQILWVLSLSKGLLRVFNARYAAFSFDQSYVMLDVLPVWSQAISRFSMRRTLGKKPAADLKRLVLESGQEWYQIIENRKSGSFASLTLLNKNNDNDLSATSIRPCNKIRPRFSKQERQALEQLQVKMGELFSEGKVQKIKTAYKRLAKVHHPDVGGDAETFKRLNEAHHQMLTWAENPQYTTRKALDDCWSYDGSTNKWSPPL